MKALVTGSAGFVGRYMCAELESRGYDVDRIDIRGDTLGVDSEVEGLRIADAVDFFALSDRHYDLVVHCAYHVGGRATIDGVPSVLSANVELDAALFRWAERTEPGRVIYFSSSAAYPTWMQTMNVAISPNVRPLRESDINLRKVEQPDSRYGWAKLNGEMMAIAYREIGGAVTIVRPASGCAWDQSPDYPFPAIAQRVRDRENPFVIWGPEHQTRDFIHIKDVVRGALAVAESGTTDPVNLCNGRATTMGELAAMMWQEAYGNLDGFNPVYDTTKPTGVFYRVLDPTRMLEYYRPAITLEDMVREAFPKS